MPRFVLLRHELPPESGKASHWDLMLEFQDRLVTWNLFELPATWAAALDLPAPPGGNADSVPADMIKDHRLAYLNYEGPLSKGRGRVKPCAHGSYRVVDLSHDSYRLQLRGGLLTGPVEISRKRGSAWQLTIGPRAAS